MKRGFSQAFAGSNDEPKPRSTLWDFLRIKRARTTSPEPVSAEVAAVFPPAAFPSPAPAPAPAPAATPTAQRTPSNPHLPPSLLNSRPKPHPNTRPPPPPQPHILSWAIGPLNPHRLPPRAHAFVVRPSLVDLWTGTPISPTHPTNLRRGVRRLRPREARLARYAAARRTADAVAASRPAPVFVGGPAIRRRLDSYTPPPPPPVPVWPPEEFLLDPPAPPSWRPRRGALVRQCAAAKELARRAGLRVYAPRAPSLVTTPSDVLPRIPRIVVAPPPPPPAATPLPAARFRAGLLSAHWQPRRPMAQRLPGLWGVPREPLEGLATPQGELCSSAFPPTWSESPRCSARRVVAAEVRRWRAAAAAAAATATAAPTAVKVADAERARLQRHGIAGLCASPPSPERRARSLGVGPPRASVYSRLPAPRADSCEIAREIAAELDVARRGSGDEDVAGAAAGAGVSRGATASPASFAIFVDDDDDDDATLDGAVITGVSRGPAAGSGIFADAAPHTPVRATSGAGVGQDVLQLLDNHNNSSSSNSSAGAASGAENQDPAGWARRLRPRP